MDTIGINITVHSFRSTRSKYSSVATGPIMAVDNSPVDTFVP